VRIDITRGGASIIGGQQPMDSFNSNPNRWGYQVTLPANSNNFADDVYTVTISAADMQGNRTNPAFTVGMITVPNR
jgi:hypothetical protein